MELVKQEYEVTYTLLWGLVKSSKSGRFEGSDYSASVRITSSNVYQMINEGTGDDEDEQEQRVIFKILCPDDKSSGVLASAIREKFRKKEPIVCTGGFPNDQRVITLAEKTFKEILYDAKPIDPKPVKEVNFKDDNKEVKK